MRPAASEAAVGVCVVVLTGLAVEWPARVLSAEGGASGAGKAKRATVLPFSRPTTPACMQSRHSGISMSMF